MEIDDKAFITLLNNILDQIKNIDLLFEEVKYIRENEKINELWFYIYKMEDWISDLWSIYIKAQNKYNMYVADIFDEKRKSNNSDLATTKKINSENKNVVKKLEYMDNILNNYIQRKSRNINKLFEHIWNMKINDNVKTKYSNL